jgi:hypothetical protein
MLGIYARNAAGRGSLLSRAVIAVALLGVLFALTQIERTGNPVAQVSIQPE